MAIPELVTALACEPNSDASHDQYWLSACVSLDAPSLHSYAEVNRSSA